MTDPYLPDHDSIPDEATPWGFRITLIAAGAYLSWRLFQGVAWVWNWLT